MHYSAKTKDEIMMTLISATMCLYRRADELRMTANLKICESDVQIIYYLVRLLEEKKDQEEAVLLISRALLIPIALALNS